MSNDLSADLASLKIDRGQDPNAKRPLRYAAITSVVLAIGLSIYLWVVPFVKARMFKTEVAVTEISLISPAQAQIELTSTGYVKPQRISRVNAKVQGRVREVAVKQGTRVERGDLLMELDMADQKAAIATANARVASARARAQTARANLAEIKLQADRAVELADKGVRPRSQAVDLEARVQSLTQQVRAEDAEVRAALAEVKSLEVNLDSYTVRAPISGTVLSKPPEIGEIAGPQTTGVDDGTGSFEIADLTTLAVETDVPEGRLHMVELGGPCEITLDAFPDRRFRGKTLEVIPRVNRAKATVTVKVGFADDASGVLPDMAARVSFLSSELDEKQVKETPKVVVPKSALVEQTGAYVVFAIDDGRVRMLPVTVGQPYANGFELVTGPPVGTRVVAHPPKGLKDGQAVKERTD